MMRLFRLALGAALAVALWLGQVHREAFAWVTSGDSLALSQRDFRVFDRFLSPGSHSNTTPHPNWPGAIEIELAAWKGGAEWSSTPVGDGSGDPTQAQVGSGNANFNFFWNGEANGIGGPNDNILSAIPGSGGGVVAFVELPTSDGWRARFYGDHPWSDGPGAVGAGELDFQSVSCHVLGHALGLAHTSVPQATMSPALFPGGTRARSIEADDIAGLQFIYDPRAAGVLPFVDQITGSLQPGGTAIVTGGNFDATGNTIWLNAFLQDVAGVGGEPVRLSNLSATAGGTQICFTLPMDGIEAGHLHVQRNRTDARALSEGHPFPWQAKVAFPDNYVPNPSFEQQTDCPTNTGELSLADFWRSPTEADADLFDACAVAGSVSVPRNAFGKQAPRTGGAYAGLLVIDSQLADRREYLEIPLAAPLKSGTPYDIRFFVSRADDATLAVENMGALLSAERIGPRAGRIALGLVPTVRNPPGRLLDDAMNWTEISGSYMATGSEAYLVIGNFEDDISTNATPVGGQQPIGYYYVDDISIIERGPLLSGPTRVSAGTTVTYTMDRFTPNGAIYLIYSENGAGPTQVPAGPCGTVTLDLSPPIRTAKILTASAGGQASFRVKIPTGWPPGRATWLQAFDFGACRNSNLLKVVVL